MRTEQTHSAFTLIEVMLVVVIISILAAIAIPGVLRSRCEASESQAIGNLHTLVNVLETYRANLPSYPGSAIGWQAALYGVDCSPGTAPDPDYGPSAFCVSMNNSSVHGYRYTYTPSAAANANGYTITADPVTFGVTGTRAFFVDESGVIRHCLGASGATAASAVVAHPPNATCP